MVSVLLVSAGIIGVSFAIPYGISSVYDSLKLGRKKNKEREEKETAEGIRNGESMHEYLNMVNETGKMLKEMKNTVVVDNTALWQKMVFTYGIHTYHIVKLGKSSRYMHYMIHGGIPIIEINGGQHYLGSTIWNSVNSLTKHLEELGFKRYILSTPIDQYRGPTKEHFEELRKLKEEPVTWRKIVLVREHERYYLRRVVQLNTPENFVLFGIASHTYPSNLLQFDLLIERMESRGFKKIILSTPVDENKGLTPEQHKEIDRDCELGDLRFGRLVFVNDAWDILIPTVNEYGLHELKSDKRKFGLWDSINRMIISMSKSGYRYYVLKDKIKNNSLTTEQYREILAIRRTARIREALTLGKTVA